jgi:hypothetical protein
VPLAGWTPSSRTSQNPTASSRGKRNGSSLASHHLRGCSGKIRLHICSVSMRAYKVALRSSHSPLTSNIYFPAIPTLVNVFHKPTALINLTVYDSLLHLSSWYAHKRGCTGHHVHSNASNRYVQRSCNPVLHDS